MDMVETKSVQATRKAILIISYYYDLFNTNSLCIEPIIACFVQNGYDVHVLCSHKKPVSLEKVDIKNRVFVHQMPSMILRVKNFTENKRHATKNRFWKSTDRALSYMINLFSLEKATEAGFLSKATMSYAKRIIEEFGISRVLSLSHPIVNHTLAYSLKEKNAGIDWTLYQIDPYTYNQSMTAEEQTKRAIFEKKLCSLADKIILTDEIWRENRREGFGQEFVHKSISVPLPNLVIGKSSAFETYPGIDPDRINLLFTGNVYNSIRKPGVLFEILSKIGDSRFVFHVFGRGMGEMMIQYPLASAQVISHGRIPKEELLEAINSASILINFGNTMENQTPSKVFDYIASGKPIVNFCFTENDTSLYYLRRYPLFLNIFNKDAGSDESAMRFKDFCLENRNASVPKERIASLYSDLLSENVCSLIIKHTESQSVR